MTAATEKELSELHKKVAVVLANKLDSANRAAKLLVQYNEELPDDVVEFLTEASDASPALLTVITKFLKDNNVTAVVEDSKELTELETRLKEKRQRKVGNVLPLRNEDE